MVRLLKALRLLTPLVLVDVQPQSNKPLDDVMIKTVNIINKGGQKITSFTDAMTKIEQENKAKQACHRYKICRWYESKI